LESQFAERKEEFYGLLAHHFDMAGERERAVDYLILAGDKARLEDAHEEAIDYYRRAIELLGAMGDPARTARTWLKLGLVYHTNFQFQLAHDANEAAFELRRGTPETSVRPSVEVLPGGAGIPDQERALRISFSSPLANLDPAQVYYPAEGWIVQSLFAGLAETDTEMNILPQVARSWEVLEGGTRYLVLLRDDVRWTDGSQVTAGDFEWAWKRNLSPRIASETAHMLDAVVGARDFREGRSSDASTIGVKALDALTLEVRLISPVAYFPYLLTLPITLPLHRASVEQYGDDSWKPEYIVSNGPFRLSRLDLRRGGRLDRNPSYFGEFPGNLRCVQWSVTPDEAWTVQDFLDNRADISLSFAGRSEATGVDAVPSGEQFDVSVVRTVFLLLSPHLPPLDDPRVRRALIHALDRKRFAEMIFKEGVPPARGGIIPPGLAGHTPELGPAYDLESARRLIAEAGYPDGRGFPRLTGYVKWIFPTLFEEIARQWREGLGIEIESHEYMPGEEAERIDRHFVIEGWLADYPDPDTFMWHSVAYSQLSQSGWRGERYEELVAQAARTPDRSRRLAMYREADRIWVEQQALVAPLFYGSEWISLVKPWVKGYQMSRMTLVFFKNISIEEWRRAEVDGPH
jgi:oligopeptide transport system substrate-binding protein